MPSRYQFDSFEIQPAARVLLESGTPVSLGARAFDLLVCLMERRDRVVAKEELIEQVWPGLVVTDNNLNVQVAGLRKLLGTESVQTVQGRGFRFAREVREMREVGEVRELHEARVAGLRVSDGVQTLPDIERRVPKIELSPSAAASKTPSDAPSIAVLPFLNMSNDPEQDYFADGITEDITTELSRFKALFVI